jgi:hypothetical protein
MEVVLVPDCYLLLPRLLKTAVKDVVGVLRLLILLTDSSLAHTGHCIKLSRVSSRCKELVSTADIISPGAEEKKLYLEYDLKLSIASCGVRMPKIAQDRESKKTESADNWGVLEFIDLF